MAERRKHHFIPAFILRRFASRRSGKSTFVWQFAKEGSGVEASVRDVAATRDFYGEPERSVEENLQSAESEHALILNQIDNGDDPNQHDRELRELVWLLAMRTRSIREQYIRQGKALLNRLGEAAVPDAGLLQYIDRSLDEHIESVLMELTPLQRSIVRHRFATSDAREQLRSHLLEQFRSCDLGQMMSPVLRMLTAGSDLDLAAADGHMNGIEQLLDKPEKSHLFAPAQWSLAHANADDRFILPDACVICYSRQGAVGPLGRFGKDWHTAILPISTHTLLIAHQDNLGDVVLPDFNSIAVDAASCSTAYFYSSHDGDLERSTQAKIGDSSALVSPEEMDSIIADVWAGFLQGN